MAAPGARPQTAEGGHAPYSSPTRSDQARATRRAIVAAASHLFVAQGYAATTIDAVAERAGVGRKTVFTSVGSKGALLKLAWDWALVGDDEPVPMAERPAVHAMLAEHDPHRLVRMWVDMVLDVGERAGPIGAVVHAAADVDPEARALRDAMRRESLIGATAFVTHLASIDGLRAGLTVEHAADTCWALINSAMQQLLVSARGWSAGEVRDWMVRIVSASLLEPDGARAAAPSVTVTHDAAERRYLATVDGRSAGLLAYESTDRLVVLLATDVAPEHEREGVAGALVRRALDDARAGGGARVVTVCPFATWWAGRHPEYAELLTGR